MEKKMTEKCINPLLQAALRYAAGVEGRMEALDLLIDSGADINAVNYDGETALSLALKNNHLQIAELLIDYGATVEKSMDSGFSI